MLSRFARTCAGPRKVERSEVASSGSNSGKFNIEGPMEVSHCVSCLSRVPFLG